MVTREQIRRRRNPVDVRRGIDAGKTTYDQKTGREKTYTKTSGQKVNISYSKSSGRTKPVETLSSAKVQTKTDTVQLKSSSNRPTQTTTSSREQRVTQSIKTNYPGFTPAPGTKYWKEVHVTGHLGNPQNLTIFEPQAQQTQAVMTPREDFTIQNINRSQWQKEYKAATVWGKAKMLQQFYDNEDIRKSLRNYSRPKADKKAFIDMSDSTRVTLAAITAPGLAQAGGFGAFGVSAVKGMSAAQVITEGTKSIGANTAPKGQQEFIYNKGQFREAMRAGKEREFSEPVSGLRSLGRSLPVGRLAFGNKRLFKEGARDYYAGQGLTGSDLNNAVKAAERQKIFGETGAGLGMAAINTATELVGRASVTAKSSATAVFHGIGKLGAAEAVSGVMVTKSGRYESPGTKEVAVAAAAGYGTAGLMGVAIAKTGPKTSGGLRTVASIMDPYESVGDVSAKGLSKIAGTSGSRIPVTTLTGVMVDTGTNTGTQTTARPSVQTTARASTNINVPSQTRSNVPIQTHVQVPVAVSTRTSVPVNVPVNVPTRTVTTSTRTIIQPGTNTFVNVPTETTTQVNIPVATATAPFLPLSGSSLGPLFGSSKKRKRVRSVTKYFPSVEAGLFGKRGKKPRVITGVELRPLRGLGV